MLLGSRTPFCLGLSTSLCGKSDSTREDRVLRAEALIRNVGGTLVSPELKVPLQVRLPTSEKPRTMSISHVCPSTHQRVAFHDVDTALSLVFAPN
jgi:hypothetical protein